MRNLIKNLLEYSRLDKDQTVLEDVDMNKIMADIAIDFEVALAQKSITVTVDDLPVVRGVPHQLNQLFYNLMGNAIKFSKPVFLRAKDGIRDKLVTGVQTCALPI